MRKIGKILFTTLLTSLVMCTSVGAVEVTVNGDFIANYTQPQKILYDTTWSSPWQTSAFWRTKDSANVQLVRLRKNDGSSFSEIKKGDYVVLSGWVVYPAFNESGNLNPYNGYWGYSDNASHNCSIKGLNQTEWKYDETKGQNGNVRNSIQVTCVVTENITNGYITTNFYFRSNASTTAGQPGFTFNMIDVYRPSKNSSDTLEQEKQNVSNASNNGNNSANSSSSDASTATTSLLSALGGFANVIINANPSDCAIEADMGHVDFGEIDLCSQDPPAFISIIGSLFLIAVTIPYCYFMFKRFINTFRSFQNG